MRNLYNLYDWFYDRVVAAVTLFCIIIISIILFAQQYAHIRQYNLEEQDSKVREEH